MWRLASRATRTRTRCIAHKPAIPRLGGAAHARISGPRRGRKGCQVLGERNQRKHQPAHPPLPAHRNPHHQPPTLPRRHRLRTGQLPQSHPRPPHPHPSIQPTHCYHPLTPPTYGMESNITYVLRVEPIKANGKDVPEGSIVAKYRVESYDGTKCTKTKVHTAASEYKSTLTLIMTWHEGQWIETQGRFVGDDAN